MTNLRVDIAEIDDEIENIAGLKSADFHPEAYLSGFADA